MIRNANEPLTKLQSFTDRFKELNDKLVALRDMKSDYSSLSCKISNREIEIQKLREGLTKDFEELMRD